jgi:hypothetical protein|tara:strand:+ start:258 stop:446 length:189 start_codon:yes stop_codon:yes gene_type:complete
MGNTVTLNMGNSGVVAPLSSEGGGSSGGGTNVSVGNTKEEEEEEEDEGCGCMEKLGCMLCSG